MKLPEQDNTFEYKFAKLKHSLKLRVLKIQLSNGDIEYLATNIFDPQITLDDFKWAYHKRWGIETKYNDVKNKLEIEIFTGYSPDASYRISMRQCFWPIWPASWNMISAKKLRPHISGQRTAIPTS